MTRTAMTITISGDKELRKKLLEYGKRGVMATMRGLRITAIEILTDAKNRLSNNGSRVTSKLFNSGRITIDAEEPNFIDVLFSGGGDGYTDYAEFVEFGRRAGKMPPLGSLTEWVRKKGLADTWNIKTKRQSKRGEVLDKRATQIAFLIARSIAKRGTKARPFLFPAFEAKKGNLIANIEKEIEKLNKDMTQ